MKKFVGILLTMAICLSMFCFPVSAYSDVKDNAEAIQVLSDLNILDGFEDGTFREDDQLTRAQAAKVMCCLLGYSDVAMGNTTFTDVPATHWASGYINTAQAARIIAGFGDGTFKPEQPVTYEQIVKMAVCALGYEPVASSMGKGEWYNGYLNIASSIGITKGVNSGVGKNATRGQFAVLLYNALDTQIMDVSSWRGDGKNEYQKTDETILSKYLEIDKWEGIVSKTPYIEYAAGGSKPMFSLTNAQRYVYDGKKLDEQFETAYCDKDVETYLGKKVVCYVGEDKIEDRVIFSVAEKEKANNSLTISATDIDRIEDNTIFYDTETSKNTQKVKLSKEIMIVKDYDVFFGDITDLDLDNAKGSITFINNDNSSEYDVVIYNVDVKVAVVKDIEKYDGIISFETLGTGNLYDIEEYDPDEDIKIVVIKDGKMAEVTDIDVDDTVSMIGDNNFKIYFVSSKIVTGKITGIDSEDNIVFIDRKEYKYDTTYMNRNSFTLSDEATFYFSFDDMIVASDVTEVAVNRFGVITRAYEDTNEDELKVEIVFSNGTSGVYRVADSKKDTIKAQLNMGRITYDQVENSLYKVTFREKDKTISKLEPIDYKDSADGKRYDAESMTYGPIDMFKSTVVFAVEGEGTKEVRVDDITVGSVDNFFVDDEGEDFEIFAYESRSDGFAIVIGKNITGTVSNKNSALIVESVSTAYIDSEDDTGYIVTGIQNGKKVEYKLFDTEKPAKGDVILLGAKNGEVIEKITILNHIDLDDPVVEFKDDNSITKVRTIIGKVDREKTDGTRLYFDNGENVLLKNSANYTLVDASGSRTTVEKKSKGINIFGSKEKYESYVFVRYYDDVQVDVVVYRFSK